MSLWRKRLRAVAVTAALSAATAAAAQPFPPAPQDRRERVAGWRVVHVPDEDGGRDVGLSLRREDVVIDYFVNYWRGNGRPFRRASIMRAGENCAGEQWNEGEASASFAPEPDIAGDRDRLRARLVGHLAQCGVGPAQAGRLLRGLARAFDRLAVFAESARRYTEALNCSIENYPEGPSVVRNRCHRRR